MVDVLRVLADAAKIDIEPDATNFAMGHIGAVEDVKDALRKALGAVRTGPNRWEVTIHVLDETVLAQVSVDDDGCPTVHGLEVKKQ